MQKKSLALIALLLVALISTIVLSVRGSGGAEAVPTVGAGDLRTEAVRTFAAGLTATVLSAPISTATSTAVPPLTTAATGSGSVTPTCNRLRWIKDVSIPDNTPMTPAQVFTKSWLVENNGTCPWQRGYQVILVGGLAMGGSPFPLATTVLPGGQIQVSIKMVTPTDQTGIVQGTWRMSDANGAPFGDILTVVVVVGGGSSTPPSAKATATHATATSTP
jgi:hypothetical protein